jgi:hypothetical protein
MEKKCAKCQMPAEEMKCKACSGVVSEAEVETHACGKDSVKAVCSGCKMNEEECACAVATCATCKNSAEECICEA